MIIQCPKCKFSKEISEDKIPPKAKLATCPKCGHKFPFREEQTEQEEYSFIEEEEETVNETQTDNQDIWSKLESLGSEDQEPVSYQPNYDRSWDKQEHTRAPWERLEEFGFFPGIYQTVKEVMFSPIQFFQSLSVGEGFNKPLIFYLLVAEIQALAQFFWQMLGVVPKMQGYPESILGIGMVGVGSILLLVIYPLILSIFLFVVSGINHLCLLAVKSGDRGYEGTFRVMSYANAPMVLAIIPVLGPMAGAAWTLVCTFLGFKYVHRATAGKIILAMLLPVFIILFLAMLFVTIKGISQA